MTNHMDVAIAQANAAALRNEVPVGAVLVKDGKVIVADGNRVLELNDPTAHAEILVIRKGAKIIGNERLIGCDLYVTLEPCPMCASAISFARIKRLYFGAEDIKSGGVDNGPRIFSSSSCHHRPEHYGGMQAQACEKLLREFFMRKRQA